MGGKGLRRREKNYRAAHGGDTRLPPPPKLRELEALPSKLRRLIAIQKKQNDNASTSPSTGGGGAPGKQGDKVGKKNKLEKEKETKKRNLKTPADRKAADNKDNDVPTTDENVNAEGSKVRHKRKRGKAMDLRFKELEENVSVSKKQKRKKHLEEKKKKRKGHKAETIPDFPGREKVKFGEVVQAPPKLSFPKVKSALDASREMLRKEAIDNYRNIKGWTSRPGLQIPALAENTSL